MRTTAIPCFFLLLGFLLSTCSSTNVLYDDINPDADFSQYRTFDFYKVNVDNQSKLEPHMENLEKVKAAIRQEMEQRGFTYSEADPDLRLNLGIVLEDQVQTRETDIRDAPIYTGSRNYHWESEEVVVREYETGTLVLDVVDANNEELLWEGSAKDVITQNQSKMEKRINNLIKRLFEKFPAQVS